MYIFWTMEDLENNTVHYLHKSSDWYDSVYDFTIFFYENNKL